MAQITIDIDDQVIGRVLDAIAKNHNYQPGSGSKGQFAKALFARWVKNEVMQAERPDRLAQLENDLYDEIERDIIVS